MKEKIKEEVLKEMIKIPNYPFKPNRDVYSIVIQAIDLAIQKSFEFEDKEFEINRMKFHEALIFQLEEARADERKKIFDEITDKYKIITKYGKQYIIIPKEEIEELKKKFGVEVRSKMR